MRLSHYSLFIAVLLVAPATGLAQQVYRLEPGARVRLTSPSLPADQRVVRIVSISGDTVVFRSERDAATRMLPLSDIREVEVSAGTRRRTARGALIGVVSGFAIGGVTAYLTYEPCEGWCFLEPESATAAGLFGGAVVGTLGLVAGTTIGWFTKSEEWRSVPTATRLGIMPSRSGPLLTISHRF